MGVTLWYQLDAFVCNVKTINIFKQIIKNMFISLYDWYGCWGMFVILCSFIIKDIVMSID